MINLQDDSSYTYTFKLTNNITTINLPYEYASRKYIKIKSMVYKTSASNMRIMAVKVTGFNNNVYYDGANITKCVKVIYLPTSVDTEVEYAPIDDKPDSQIKEILNMRNPTKSVTIEIDIDGTYTGVSSLYPVYIEMSIY